MAGPAVDLSNLPADLAEPVTDLAAAIGTIEAQVQRLQGASWAATCKGLSPLEVARMHLMVSYTINTLFYLYLKTQGLPTAGHPVLEELERVKAYIRKVKQVSQAQAQARGVAPEATNQAAAQRFISETLAGTSERAPAVHTASTPMDDEGAKEPPPQPASSSTEAELRAALKKLKPAGPGADADEAVSGQLGALLQQHARDGGVLQGGAPGGGTAGGSGSSAAAGPASGTPKRKGEGGATPGSEKKKKKKSKSNKAAL